MLQSLIRRAVSLTLAAVFTVAMLGSIDSLSQPDAGAAQWAQKSNAPRA
jgi:hypothetical protein